MNLNFIDLFAGIGGIRLGFQDLFGNSVSVPVIKAIATEIKKSLELPRAQYKVRNLDLFSYYNYENSKVANL